MKKLQNNFTTPEQSKRLLELGVPADSADCAYRLGINEFVKMLILIPKDTTYTAFADSIFRVLEDRCLPCWSVGRLIEVMTICYKWDLLSCASFRIYITDIISHNLINQLINDLSLEIRRGKIDFLKLEG